MNIADSHERISRELSSTVMETGTTRGTQRQLNLKPVIFFLGLAGCYSFQSQRNILSKIIMVLYKIIMVGTALFWCILTTMENLQSPVICVMVLLITLQSVSSWTICWKTFSKAFGKFQAFVKDMNALLGELYHKNIIVNENYIIKRQMLCLILAAFLIISDATVQIIIAFSILPSPEEPKVGTINGNGSLAYTYPLADSYFTRLLIILPTFFLTLALVIPPFFLTIINSVLLALFNALNAKIEEYIDKKEGFLDSVEMFRKFHVKTCATIFKFDKDLCYLYGSIFFWTLCQGIFVLYLLIKSGRSVMELMVLVYMMGLSVVVLIAMSVSAAQVHEAVSHLLLPGIRRQNFDKTFCDNIESLYPRKMFSGYTGINLFVRTSVCRSVCPSV